MTWQPIETAPAGVQALLYFPQDNTHRLPEWITVEYLPCRFNRKPTHWIPLPEPPAARARQMREGA